MTEMFFDVAHHPEKKTKKKKQKLIMKALLS